MQKKRIYMKFTDEFPFVRAKRVSKSEVEKGRKAIEKLTGRVRHKRPGRPPKALKDKYVPVSIKIHPLALSWLKKEAKKRALPYQSIINQLLLEANFLEILRH